MDLLSSLRSKSAPNTTEAKLQEWVQALKNLGILNTGDIEYMDDETFSELCQEVSDFILRSALRKLRKHMSGSTVEIGQQMAGREKPMSRQYVAGGQHNRPALLGHAAASSTGSGVGMAIAGHIVGKLAECNTILQTTVQIVGVVQRLYQQAKANKEKCQVLAIRVQTLELPLNEVGKLIQSGKVAKDRADVVAHHLSATNSSVDHARVVIESYVDVRDRKGFFKRMKEVLMSGATAADFEHVMNRIHSTYNDMHQLLTMLAAVDKLSEFRKPSSSSQQDLASANKLDLSSLHADLVKLAGGDAQFRTDLQSIGWGISDMQAAIRGQLDRIEDNLRIVSTEVHNVKLMVQQILDEKKGSGRTGPLTGARAGEARPLKPFANSAAGWYWEQYVEGIVDDRQRIRWEDFAATVFSNLASLNIDKRSWEAIEPDMRRKFDPDGDGFLTRQEYDVATSVPRPATVIELCQEMLYKLAVQPAPLNERQGSRDRASRSTMVLTKEVVQAALAAEKARMGPSYLPMTALHARLVECLSDSFEDDAKTRFAFMSVPRRLFAPEPLPSGITPSMVYENKPIMHGFWHQSQPSVYVEALKHMRIDDNLGAFSFLCVGSGSGYLNALVSVMQGWRGRNYGIELRSDMVALSRSRIDAFCDQINVQNNISIRAGNAFVSLDSRTAGTFDRIYVAAAINLMDVKVLLPLLSPNGIMLAPVSDLRGDQQTLDLFEKHPVTGHCSRRQLLAVRFKSAVKAITHPHDLTLQPPSRRWVCDNCRISDELALQSKRYRCSRRCDFDLCGDCYTAMHGSNIQ